ncbi:pyridoxal-phosphate dependent enzyme [bacterium]|nr:pyridoxal-phosphate dependent enzyme [bacterium]
MSFELPPWKIIEEAHERIRPYIHRTPILTCQAINDRVGSEVFFKCDNLQKVGAFKIRGATNAVMKLSPEIAARGVVTHSSGNHAQALSLAARWRGIPAYIVMPEDAPRVKKEAVAEYGGKITYCRPTVADRQITADRVQMETGATFIHPYDNDDVIAGQGTAAKEFLEDQPDLDVLLAPVGGGGLLAGTLLAAKGMKPSIQVFAMEPARVDDAKRSLAAGRILENESTQTIADGLKTNLGERTFPIIAKLVDDVITVPEEDILPAMRFVFERMKIVIEPSSAVPVAPLLTGELRFPGKRIGVHLCGGNIDISAIDWGSIPPMRSC